MSVYIKGRKPPNSCDDCWVSDCPNDEHIDGYRMMGRPTYCPLIPVPDHGDLIERDAFESIKYELPKGQKAFNRGFHSAVQYVQRLIMDTPTIIPADKE